MNPTSFHIYLKILESLDRQYIEPEEFYDLETRVVDLEAAPIGDLSQIQSDVSSLQTSQTTQDSAITSLQGTSMVHTTNIANNASAISALDARVTQNETDIANLPGGGGGSAITVQDNGTPLSTDVSLVNFVGFTLTEPVADEITVTAIPTDLTAVNNAIAGNTANINTNSTNITANSTAITTNANNISSNDTDIANNATAISGLDTRVTTAESNITALQSADDVITVQDEGTPLSTTVNTINFTGAGVTASHNAGVATVDIPGGGGGSALEVEDEGVSLSTAVTKINFAGAGVTVTEPVADEMLVTIPGGGGGGTTPTYARASLANNWVFVSGAGVRIEYDTFITDDATNFSLNPDNQTIDVVNSGLYVIYCNFDISGASTGRCNLGITLNGVNQVLYRLQLVVTGIAASMTTGAIAIPANSTVQSILFQDSGSSINALAPRNTLSILRLT